MGRRNLSVLAPTCALVLAHVPSLVAFQQPFPTKTAPPTSEPATPTDTLFGRQIDGCISGTYSCASQGSAFDGICCADGQACALDWNNSPACCPFGAVCTGTAPASYRAPSTTSVSYVANAYFSFPYIATSFSNAAACSRAVSQCNSNYAACTANLEAGAGGAVTIVVPAGNGATTTMEPHGGTALPTESATSVCRSLSSVACHTIQDSYCTAGSTAGFTVGTSNAALIHMPYMSVIVGCAAAVFFGGLGII